MSFTVFSGTDYSALQSQLLASNSGINIVNGSFELVMSGPGAVNLYNGSETNLGIGAGLLLTSGTTPGTSNTQSGFGSGHGAAGDSNIDTVVNTVFSTSSYDATTIEFDFTVSDPNAKSVTFDLVFGSEEFPEYANSYVDAAIVMVNGVNYALFNNNTSHPLSVLQSNIDAGYFRDNTSGSLSTEYDGVSYVLKIVAPITTSGVNHIKIGIADTRDDIYDSGMFIANLASSTVTGSGTVITNNDGTDGNDNIAGSGAAEYFDLGGGDDTLETGGGNDIVDGGLGSDTVIYDGNYGNFQVTDLGNGVYQVTDLSGTGGTDTLTNVELLQFLNNVLTLDGAGLNVVGPTKPGGTTYIGAALSDLINGTEANDKISAGDGDNTVIGGGGNDKITAGSGDDTIIAGSGNDSISAGDGDNTITGGAGNNKIAAGSGDDEITSGDGNDKITAGDGENSISAGGGNNGIVSGSGADDIETGSGNDKIAAGDGANTISAGDGNNAITSGSGSDNIESGNGNDKIVAGDGNNIVEAGDGKNTITTGSGNDDVTAGSGSDTAKLGAGSDSVNLGAGKNTIFLGEDTDADTVYFDDDFFAALTDGDAATLAFNKINNIGAGDVIEFSGFVLGAGDIRVGTTSELAADIDLDYKITLNTSTGKLYYDADGGESGSAAIQIGLVKGSGLALAQEGDSYIQFGSLAP